MDIFSIFTTCKTNEYYKDIDGYYLAEIKGDETGKGSVWCCILYFSRYDG